MKTVSILFVMMVVNAITFGQPVIVGSANLPAVGYTAGIMNGPASIPPGAGGAAMVWNFGTLSLNNVGSYAILSPGTTPVAATYPSGNHALSVTPTGGSAYYSYYITGATNMSELANSVTTTAGSGRNYTPGPRKILKFPFNYTDTFTATYATATNSGHDFCEYDGYGTLVTPWATYTNVVRIKTTYTTAIGYAISWYILSPLICVLSYDSNSNTYSGLSATPTETAQVELPNTSVVVAPNPFTTSATIKITTNLAIHDACVFITDITGKVVRQIPVSNGEAVIQKEGLNPGVYFYQVLNGRTGIANGKLIIQ